MQKVLKEGCFKLDSVSILQIATCMKFNGSLAAQKK